MKIGDVEWCMNATCYSPVIYWWAVLGGYQIRMYDYLFYNMSVVYFIRFRVLLSYTFVYSVESGLYYFHTFCRIFVYWWLYRPLVLNRVSSVIRYFSNIDLILPDVANPLLTSASWSSFFWSSFFWPLWPEWAAPSVSLHLHHFLLRCFLSA